MKINATLVRFQRFARIGYYSVKAECYNRCETDMFLEKMYQAEELRDELRRLVYWIGKIGKEIGAVPDYFRYEGLCNAFPPPVKVSNEYIGLRLYCYIINENIVVLYNGGKKVGNPAEKCPNVAHHFRNAQSWSKKIQQFDIEATGTTINNLEDIEFIY